MNSSASVKVITCNSYNILAKIVPSSLLYEASISLISSVFLLSHIAVIYFSKYSAARLYSKSIPTILSYAAFTLILMASSRKSKYALFGVSNSDARAGI